MSTHPITNIHLALGMVLAFIYCLLLILEQKRPLRKPSHSLFARLVVNFFFTILVFICGSLLIGPLAKSTINLSQTHHFGLLPQLPVNGLFVFIFGFLLMDLSFYYWHRLNHEIPLLWRFHNVHHIDPDLDVTTSMRFHFVEIIYSSIFRFIQLTLIGLNPVTFICYEFVFQASTLFQHSNLKLPIRFERMMNWVLVTPRMHGIHHSDYQEETNSNYGVIFSFWDRLHHSIKLNVPQQLITIGIPGYHKQTDNKLLNLLLMPFKTQRDYWKINNKIQINRTLPQLDENASQLSE